MNMMWSPTPSDCGAVVEAAEALAIREYDFTRVPPTQSASRRRYGGDMRIGWA